MPGNSDGHDQNTILQVRGRNTVTSHSMAGNRHGEADRFPAEFQLYGRLRNNTAGEATNG